MEERKIKEVLTLAKNENLCKAKAAKNDEFYTLLSDIENELKHYEGHFKGAVVLCNCDDPTWSNFWRYFHINFDALGLKKLISTHYDAEKLTYKMEYAGGNDNDISAGVITPLSCSGDFRSPECVELLKQADIIATNPPFSLFREYVAQLVKYDKKFIIIGNMNAITYKEIFPLFKDYKIWYGHSISSGDRKFNVPDDYPLNATGCGVDEDGKKYIRVKGVRWFTNLEHQKRHEIIDLIEHYTPEKYPKYDNYDAINVNKTCDIPCNYDGCIGVPITFLDKYNPDQFEILDARDFAKNDRQRNKNTLLIKDADSAIEGKPCYARILIKRRNKK